MINKILLGLSTLIIAISIAFEVNFLDYSPPIEHKNISIITLSDFKGFKRLNQTLHGNSEFAFIETEIKIIGNRYPYVIAYFHPSRSYTYKTNMIGDKNLLTHELYHFHITEYIARKMRQDISMRNDIDAKDLTELLKVYKAKENTMQQEYDVDTYHSYFSGKQISWQTKIDSLLLTLDKYK
jgi:hypothetical protein